MVPIVRAFADPWFKRVTFVMGTQMGKTASLFNVIGWKLDDQPEPVIYIGPSQSNIDNVVEGKIVEMFRECPSLWDKLLKGKKSSKHRKAIAGTTLRLAWAGSGAEIASDSAALTFVDELDRPDPNATGEGDLVELAEARGDAYASSKLGLTSTPTEGRVEYINHPDTGFQHWMVSDMVVSPIWHQWQEGTRHEWAVPCTECAQYFIPKSHLLWYPENATPAEAGKHARLACPNCGAMIEDKDRTYMNSLGVYVAPGQSVEDGRVAGKAETEGNSNASFWVSGLCSFSAKKSYGHLAEKLVKAIRSGDPHKIQAVYNTGFGEIYSPAGDTPKWQDVYNQRGSHKVGEVCGDVAQLICTLDVQGDRFVYVVRAWQSDFTSYLVEFGEIWVDTDKPQAVRELQKLLDKSYDGYQLDCMGIDAGYRKDIAHTMVRNHRAQVYALRGRDTLSKPFQASKVDVNWRGKTIKNGVTEWHFHGDVSKSWIHSRIGWPTDEPGAWFLPVDITEDYCKQIVAEERHQDRKGRGVWKQVSRDNHFLDAEGMNYMLARIRQLQDRKPKAPDAAPAKQGEKPKKSTFVKTGRSNWLNR